MFGIFARKSWQYWSFSARFLLRTCAAAALPDEVSLEESDDVDESESDDDDVDDDELEDEWCGWLTAWGGGGGGWLNFLGGAGGGGWVDASITREQIQILAIIKSTAAGQDHYSCYSAISNWEDI